MYVLTELFMEGLNFSILMDQSFTEYWLYHVPRTALDNEDAAVNKIDKFSALLKLI